MAKGNAVIGQSGGPTSVINASLAGVMSRVRESGTIGRLLGMNYGIEGFMQQRFFDLDAQPDDVRTALRHTPSSALGSSRHKVRDDDLPRILEILKKREIRYFFLIGGNDTMDTIHRVVEYCRRESYELVGVGIPKTVDNDLFGTDHTPGFPSAARSNILNVMQAGTLARDMRKVDPFVVYQTIGRDAGWLSAATALARRNEDDAPHLIYCPERTFSKERFLKDAQTVLDRHGWLSVVVSEGLRYEDGTPVSASRTADKFGNVEYGAAGGTSVAMNVHAMLREAFGLRGEFQIPESLIMSAVDRATLQDQEEAYRCGVKAVEIAEAGEGGVMVTIRRESDDPYRAGYGSEPLRNVAVHAKAMPEEYINPGGNGVTDAFLAYMRPLVTDLPHYVRLKQIFA